jgi:type VI secretion system secreted protein VgrG
VRTVTETALVVGPEGSEIHTDEHGRIRVRFHWQEGRAKGDHAACWARVAEPWAGASWGSQWLPRVGMEVLVSFLGGDASRPVVVGCLRNATHPAPFVLPRDKATSGIRTRSTPGGDGYNELAFQDEKGAEVVGLRAERDLTMLVQHDAAAAIGHDQQTAVANDRHATIGRDETIEVGRRLSTTVAGTAHQEMSDQTVAHATGGGAGMTLSGGNASLQTKGNISLRAGGDIAIDAAGNITITAGGTVTVQAAGALSVSGATLTAEAGGAVVIKGGTVDLNP